MGKFHMENYFFNLFFTLRKEIGKMPNYSVRSGLQPERNDKLVFNITTSEAQKYLQRKFDVVTRLMQKGGDDIGQVRVYLLTTDAGSRFRPFMLLLPLNVLERYERKNPDEPDIFNPEDDGEFAKSAVLKKEIKTLISAFKYDSYDKDSFFGKDWRRARGVSIETARNLRMYVNPRIVVVGEKEQKTKMVQVLIDPIRLFYDMLIFDNNDLDKAIKNKLNPNNDRSDFRVDIHRYKKIRSGEYRYTVYRVKLKSSKKDKGYSNRLAEELNRAINGSR